MTRLVALGTALLLAGCGFPYTPRALPPANAPALDAAAPAAAYTPPRQTGLSTGAPVTILLSIDGFRPDCLDRGATPTLSALARHGDSALMRPSLPAETVPNRWTLVTGLRPDRAVPSGTSRAIETEPYASLAPTPGHEKALAGARLHHGANPRVPEFLCLADTGWLTRAAPEMRALFIAQEPAFGAGRRLPPFDNVAVAPLLDDPLGLPPGSGMDGDDALFRTVLRRW